ncbi:PREDICTED: DAN domain family member 5 [Chrysochloris asiatica]|uniref:DAN domain family member 5 n=1 Tax=Chrysochloris asiatica TaxID=185453 RepID=A0A9B0U8K3_CHRAS|nr:PREDICTED: DAN domain family member 5 [Chrysochloris asiatica]
MLLSHLTTLLSLFSVAWLPIGSDLALVPQGPPPQLWAAANRTWALSRESLSPQVPASALDSWKAFLSLQKNRWPKTVATATTVTLPLDPQEMARESCKARPFTQVLSRPGCTTARLHNHLCFGHCSSLYIPSSDPSPIILCSSCIPTQKHWTPVVLWCQTGSLASRRQVKMFTMLIEECQCRPKLTARPGRHGKQCLIHAARRRHGNAPAPPSPRAEPRVPGECHGYVRRVPAPRAPPPHALFKVLRQQGAPRLRRCLESGGASSSS